MSNPPIIPSRIMGPEPPLTGTSGIMGAAAGPVQFAGIPTPNSTFS